MRATKTEKRLVGHVARTRRLEGHIHQFSLKFSRRETTWKYLVVGVAVILKYILRKYDVRVKTALKWLRLGSDSKLFLMP
jgi:hypothetical protein